MSDLHLAAKELGYTWVAHFNLNLSSFLLFAPASAPTEWSVKLQDLSCFRVIPFPSSPSTRTDAHWRPYLCAIDESFPRCWVWCCSLAVSCARAERHQKSFGTTRKVRRVRTWLSGIVSVQFVESQDGTNELSYTKAFRRLSLLCSSCSGVSGTRFRCSGELDQRFPTLHSCDLQVSTHSS